MGSKYGRPVRNFWLSSCFWLLRGYRLRLPLYIHFLQTIPIIFTCLPYFRHSSQNHIQFSPYSPIKSQSPPNFSCILSWLEDLRASWQLSSGDFYNWSKNLMSTWLLLDVTSNDWRIILKTCFKRQWKERFFCIEINSLKKLKFFERFFQKFIFYRKTNKKVFKKH